jgi:4'-phosphopantetheinyl transferase
MNFNELSATNIHIHQVNLDQLVSQWDYLADEEKKRAEKMPIEKFRQRFINSRGYLRYCLSQYLQCNAASIDLMAREKGKLYLPANNLFFNVSHSNEQALFAFNYDHEIGIDIEHQRTLKDMKAIADRVFSNTELSALNNVDDEKKQELFFTLWTRKEAVIKATGTGLTANLTDITTTNIDGNIANPIAHIAPLELQLIDLTIAAPYKAALAARVDKKQILIIG